MRIALGVVLLLVASRLCWESHHLFTGHGSGLLYCGWFGALSLVGFLSGIVWPGGAVWGALLITWSQSMFVYWQLNAVGELEHPSRSTGGMVEWGIVTVFLIAFSPVPAAASWYGRRLRCGPAQQAQAAGERRSGARG